MKSFPQHKINLLAAALALGLFAPLRAADTAAVPGQLGQRYATAGFGIIDVHNTSYDERSYRFAYNQDVAAGLDVRLDADYLRSEAMHGLLYQGEHYTDRNLALGVRAYTVRNRLKPYAEAGAGWTWFELADWREDSWLWYAGLGVELAVSQRVVVTPYLRYTDRVDLFRGDNWDYGIRANYALTSRLALTATLDRNNDQNMEYQLGTVWHF
jgi:opacity protein-like surface antigen